MTAGPRYKFDHSAEQRDCALYYVDVIDHVTGQIVPNDYVGETARASFIRFMEHLYDQPWGDLIVGKPHVDPRTFTSKAAVLEAEETAVRTRKPRPRLNDEYNRDNPHRIPVYTQRAQRAQRDAAKGIPSRWTLNGKPNPNYEREMGGPARQTPATRPTPDGPTQTTRLPAAWRRRLLKAAAFPLATGLLWLALALYAAPRVTGEHWQAWPVLSLALVTWPTALWQVVPRVRGKGAKGRRENRQLAALGITVAVAVLASALYGWWTGG